MGFLSLLTFSAQEGGISDSTSQEEVKSFWSLVMPPMEMPDIQTWTVQRAEKLLPANSSIWRDPFCARWQVFYRGSWSKSRSMGVAGPFIFTRHFCFF